MKHALLTTTDEAQLTPLFDQWEKANPGAAVVSHCLVCSCPGQWKLSLIYTVPSVTATTFSEVSRNPSPSSATGPSTGSVMKSKPTRR